MQAREPSTNQTCPIAKFVGTHPIRFRKLKLGEILISRGLITREELQTALDQHKKSGGQLSARFKVGGKSLERLPRTVTREAPKPS